jgi:hypothetical protein
MRPLTAKVLQIVLAGATALLCAAPEGARARGFAPSPEPAASRPVSTISAAASAEVTIVGPDGRSKRFTASMLAALPVARVAATSHEKTVTYSGADMADVLRAAGIDPPHQLRGAAVKRVLLAQGADGYVAAFSFAELDPSLGGRKVYLVDRADDKPLAEDGPWRLVVPQDARAARWVRQLTRITVIDP